MSQKRIIDKRRKEKYIIDDEYLNGMARLCGWQGTIVYNSLCRHASKDQECFPSLQKMAEQHGVNRQTILKGVKNLEKRNVIKIEKKRTKSGQWLNNVYILLDKTEWNYSTQVHEVDTVQVHEVYHPSPRGGLDQVHEVDTKETHSEGNTSKETHTFAKQSFAEWDNDIYIQELISSKQPHISLIGKYFKQRGLKFPDKEAAQAEVKRWTKDAKFISKYTQKEIDQVFKYVSTNYPQLWNLSTMRKYIADPIIWN